MTPAATATPGREHTSAPARLGALATLFALLAAILLGGVAFGSQSASAAPVRASSPVSAVGTAVGTPVSTSGANGRVILASAFCDTVACPTGNGQIAPACASGSGNNHPDSSDLLAINRWSGSASNLHTELGASFTDDIDQKIMRNVLDSTLLDLGNTLWQASTNMTTAATRFCLLDTVGQSIDQSAARIGRSVVHSPIVGGLLAATVLMILWRLARGGSNTQEATRRIFTAVLVLSLFSIMLLGASKTRTLGNGMTEFGSGSPGWFATKINNTISSLATMPAMEMVNPASLSAINQGDQSPLSCNRYREQLYKLYRKSYGSTRSSESLASTSLVMSAMWESTGLKSWSNVQFGGTNPYGDYVNCRLLDQQSTTINQGSATDLGNDSSIGITRQTMTPAERRYYPVNTDALAWAFGNRNWDVDVSMVGWAACRMNPGGQHNGWKIADPRWNEFLKHAQNNDGHPDPADACHSWWSTNQGDFGGTTCQNGECSALAWPDSSGTIESAVRASTKKVSGMSSVEEFMLNLHGDANGSAFAISLIYVIAALVMMIVFGGMALAVLIAKVASTVMILITFLVLTLALVPSKAEDSRVVSFFKTYAGMALFVFGLQVVFAIVVIITSFLVEAGTKSFGAGSFGATLWTGFAPVTAVVVLHQIFKHALKVPSPFKLSGALAWGAAAGGMGAAAGMGFDRMTSRAGSSARRAGAHSGKKMLRKAATNLTPHGRLLSAASKLTGRDKGGKGGMTPQKKGTTGPVIPTGAGAAGAGAVGAGAGAVGAAVGGAAATAAEPLDRKTAARQGAAEKLAAAQERVAARRFDRQQKGSYSERAGKLADTARSAIENPAEVGYRARQAAKDKVKGSATAMRARTAFANMRAKPFRTAAKGAAVAGAGLLAASGAPITVGAVAGLYARRKVKQATAARRERRAQGGMDPQERVSRRERRDRERLTNYREYQSRLDAHRAQEGAARREQAESSRAAAEQSAQEPGADTQPQPDPEASRPAPAPNGNGRAPRHQAPDHENPFDKPQGDPELPPNTEPAASRRGLATGPGPAYLD